MGTIRILQITQIQIFASNFTNETILFEQFDVPGGESVAAVEVQDAIHVFGDGADNEAGDPVLGSNSEQAFQEVAAYAAVAKLGPDVDVLNFQAGRLQGQGVGFVVEQHGAIDVANDLALMLGDKEVLGEAFKIGDEVFGGNMDEDVGDAFFFPAFVELQDAFNILAGAWANKNVWHVYLQPGGIVLLRRQ